MSPFLGFLAGVGLNHLFPYFPVAAAVLGLCAAAYFLGRARLAALVLLAMGLVYPLIHNALTGPFPLKPGVQEIAGYFASSAKRYDNKHFQDFHLASGGTVAVLSGAGHAIGRSYMLRAEVVAPEARLNPGARGQEPYAVLREVLREGGEVRTAGVRLALLRERIDQAIALSLSPEAAGLASAVTTGSRSALGGQVREDFRRAGLAHLLSISGTHFGVFALLVFGASRRLIEFLPHRTFERMSLYVTPAQAGAVATVPFMALYLGISGAEVPAVRSFIMMGLFLGGFLVARKSGWLNALTVAAAAIAAAEPEAMLSLSFQLSFAAVFFIGALVGKDGRWRAWTEARQEGRAAGAYRKFLLAPLLVTLAATAGTAPLVAYNFNNFSIISPAANLLVVPLVGFVLVPLSLLGALCVPVVGSYATAPLVEWAARGTLALASFMAGAPWAEVPVRAFAPAAAIFFYAGFFLWWRRGGRAWVALAVAPALFYALAAYAAGRPLAVTFLDVGRADAAVVELPDGKVLVVDAGRTGREVETHLKRLGASRVDALVLTHGHSDHAGGGAHILRGFEVREVWDSGIVEYDPGLLVGVRRRVLGRGQAALGPGYRITVLHPYDGFYTYSGDDGDSENNDSLVLRVEGETASFLLTGDIEAEAIEDILHLETVREGGVLRASLLKVPHHGMNSKAIADLFSAVGPEAAVVTGGSASQAVELGAARARLLFTRRDGAVRARETSRGLRIQTYREFRMEPAHGLRGEMHNAARLFRAW